MTCICGQDQRPTPTCTFTSPADELHTPAQPSLMIIRQTRACTRTQEVCTVHHIARLSLHFAALAVVLHVLCRLQLQPTAARAASCSTLPHLVRCSRQAWHPFRLAASPQARP
eukprot:TRINITY_DN7380_c0_g1_i1.p1 TRINITY_DN7380_c0_g1~~TRINITY_DN7380_c0_g1_i1.p1  ORF type:complete len:113 (+),score=8.29 TRINITY_DN7380_c0_g1_i1:902-1240(+)